jgi:hypothetical protein
VNTFDRVLDELYERYLLNLLNHRQLNGVGDEFRMLLDNVLDALLLEVLKLILLEVEADLGTTTERRVDSIRSDGESASSSRLPDVLLVVIVLGDDLYTLGNKICGVEADTELSNHRNVGAGAESLHEALHVMLATQNTAFRLIWTDLRAGLGNRTKVVDHVSLGHTDTRIANGEGLVLLVGNDADEEILAAIKDRWVGKGLVADFVESIGSVGDDLPQKDFLVRVEGICKIRQCLSRHSKKKNAQSTY